MITRKPLEIAFRFDQDGSVSAVKLHVLITDTEENTAGGTSREIMAAGVLARAQALYDQIAALALGAGKPLTF